jgi:hypothetical protein
MGRTACFARGLNDFFVFHTIIVQEGAAKRERGLYPNGPPCVV